MEVNCNYCRWKSYSSRKGSFKGIPTNLLVFTIEAPLNADLLLKTIQPVQKEIKIKVKNILEENYIEKMSNSFTSESLLIHKGLLKKNIPYNWQIKDEEEPMQERGFYYLRIL
ncbi:MAG: hypothetical protein ACOCP8_09495 [archaeon]